MKNYISIFFLSVLLTFLGVMTSLLSHPFLHFFSFWVISFTILLFFQKKYFSKLITNEKNSTPKDLVVISPPMNYPENLTEEMENYRKEYIGNISHEMKTPLFLIQSYLETIKTTDIEPNTQSRYLDRISLSTERLINMVKDLDFIHKFESGEITLHYSTFDINQLITQVFELLEIKSKNNNTKLFFSAQSKPIIVNADKEKITQVLINLIINAINYSNREEAKIFVNTYSLENKVFVEVKDNGVGIKPKDISRIFERFYRVEPSRNRKEGGSGIGLSVVKHIIEAHKQNISVESEYLNGTKFSFTLEKG